MENSETYLGDGIYCSFDGQQFVLRVPPPVSVPSQPGMVDHWAATDHVIALQPLVLAALVRWYQDLMQHGSHPRHHSREMRHATLSGGKYG